MHLRHLAGSFSQRFRSGCFLAVACLFWITIPIVPTTAGFAHEPVNEEHTSSNNSLPGKTLVQFGVPPMKDMKVGNSWDYGEIVSTSAFGLGTANDQDFPQFLASEVIILDGVAYVFDQDLNKLTTAPEALSTPYAVVSRYQSEAEVLLQGAQSTYQALQTEIKTELPNTNDLYVLVLTGSFAEVEIAKAHGPQPLTGDLISFSNVEGTMVGLYSPSFLGSLTEQPFHFHFVSKDLSSGGHVKGVKTDEPLTLTYMKADTYTVHWPNEIEYTP